MKDFKENVIEWITGDECKIVTVSASQQKLINAIKKYAEQRPDECQITALNDDGSIVAHVPTSWVTVRPPRKMNYTEEQKQERVAKMKAAKATKATKKR